MNRNLFAAAGLCLITVSPALLFFPYAYLHAVDFPYYDDFGDAAGLVVQWQQTGEWWRKVSLLVEQNFDHRVFLLKAVVIGYYLLTEHLNFRLLILFGDLALLGIWLQYYLLTPNPIWQGWILFAIAALLFQAQHYESTVLWMTCALQHAPCVFLTTFAIQQAVQRRPVWAMTLALLTMLSSANGLITPILVLIVQLNVKQYKSAMWGSVVFTAVAIWHLSTFRVQSGSHPLTNLLTDQPARILSMFAFAGGFTRSFSNAILVQQIVGIAMLVPVMLGLYRLIYVRKPITVLQWISLGGLIFVWFTAFLITQLRNAQTDYGFLNMARYYIYFIFFPVFSIGYLFCSDSESRLSIRLQPAVAILSAVFCLYGYYHYYGDMIAYRKEISLNQPNYAWSRVIYYPSVFNEPVITDRFATLYEEGIVSVYEPSDKFTASSVLSDTTRKITVGIRQYADSIVIVNSTLLVRNSQKSDGVYMLLFDDKKQPSYVFSASHSYERAYKTFARYFYRPVAPGFKVKFYTEKLKPGTYSPSIVVVEKGRVSSTYYMNKITL